MCAVTSADGGSITAPKSQKGSLVTISRVLSASNAPHAPSLDCMPVSQRTARSMAGRALAGRPSGVAGNATRRSARMTSAVSSVSG